MAEHSNNGYFMGITMKHISLVTLIFQNSALILIMHYSRIMPTSPNGRYLTSTAVLMNEVIKLLISAIVAYHDQAKRDGLHRSILSTMGNVYSEVFKPDHWKLAIPAALYTLQNSLQYIAVSNLDAATFQVTYQLKILTTALFSVTMLGRQLSPSRWVSLIILTVGVAIVQIPTPTLSSSDTGSKPSVIQDVSSNNSTLYEGTHNDHDPTAQMNKMLGLTAVIIACIISGLAGVYFEKVLKGASATIWVRNIQLSFYSLFPAFFIGVVLKDGAEISKRGFFSGYNVVVWTAIGFQAVGGIVVALCINYADNIAKNFATSISIILSCIASVFYFNFVISFNFLIGSLIVIFATYLYSKPDSEKIPENTATATYTLLGKDHNRVIESIVERGEARI
ncbi:hypothetical protein H072_1883 [Dactylellina haptotyla CBS 200.50]|uniref:Sugar phosphate transporter domain-containing protein n=1 Tax=Dactylellina haptotyla (strain CBS 200.50) TaxID=1284197 RepID=S8AMN2_DACHA|nr:hypothetical protein H072_1883 [Dactylellina haptotyla CBS 200.50]